MRYLVLVALNLPIIFLAYIKIIVQYKLHKISLERFRVQMLLWLIVCVGLIASFPVYNYLSGAPLLDSASLSGLDILQTTIIVYLIYVINDHRRKIELSEKTMRNLHQELSIKFAKK